MRVLRQVPDHRGDVEIEFVVKREHLAQYVRIAKVLDGRGLRQQDARRVFECT